MNESLNKTIPLKEGLWAITKPGDIPRLLGSKCEACGEIYFPKKEKNWCVQCYQKALKDVELSRKMFTLFSGQHIP